MPVPKSKATTAIVLKKKNKDYKVAKNKKKNQDKKGKALKQSLRHMKRMQRSVGSLVTGMTCIIQGGPVGLFPTIPWTVRASYQNQDHHQDRFYRYFQLPVDFTYLISLGHVVS